MKKLAFAALLTGFLAACGGGDDGIGLVADADNRADATLACNPVAQTGCAADQKCTWINIDSANDVGTLGCVPDGDVALGGACAYGADGETTGYDNCEGGNICIYSQCEAICTDAPDTCGATSACSSYAGLFPDTSNFGACDFLCDPVSQERTFDTADKCGEDAASTIKRGCFANPDDTFSCTGIPMQAQTLMQGATAYGPASGGAYVNGCAAGFAPLLRKANDSTAPVGCFAFCAPQETYMGNTLGLDGVPGSGYTCNDRGAVGQIECRYYWFTMGTTPAADQNGVGFCLKPVDYLYDDDEDTTTPDVTFPSCADLPNTDTDGDGTEEHLSWSCAPYPAEATGVPNVKTHADKFPLRGLNEDELKHFQK